MSFCRRTQYQAERRLPLDSRSKLTPSWRLLGAFIVGLITLAGFRSFASAQATDLFISEYIEGSSVNKAIEIYNGTGADVDLSGGAYTLELYSNGSSTPSQSLSLAGTITNGDVFVLANSGAAAGILAETDVTNNSVINFNGDDAIVLKKNGVVIDVIGQVGFDPGSAWSIGDVSTANNTMVRLPTVCTGDPVESDIFDPSIEWSALGNDIFTSLGTHVANCGGGGGPTGQPFPLFEGFDTDDCTSTGWQVVSVDTDQANTWACSAQFSNADVNGFGDTAPADEWLISPALNMNTQSNETLDFRSLTRFTDVNYPQLEVLYSSDYDGAGDPTTGTWTALSGITFSAENSNTYADSGSIDLSGISGSNVYFAFHYTSSGTGSGTAANWRVDSVDFDIFDPTVPVAAKIHEVQGTDPVVALNGRTVIVNAIVVGDFQANATDTQLRGFFIQEEDADADADPATSEGIFVFCNSCPTDVAVGDLVEVTGVAVDFFGMSQIDVTQPGGSVSVVSSGNPLPSAAVVDLPSSGSTRAEATFENVEGMLVTFADTLVVSEYFELARYGQLVLTVDARPQQFTDANEPSVVGYAAFLDDLNTRRIILDDDNNIQNDAIGTTDEPYFWPRPGLSTSNFVRGGDSISNLTGIMHWSFAGQSGTDAWRIRPVEEAFTYTFASNNPRTAAPEAVGGTFKVASFNVLNYFTTIDSRGADSAAELDRQRAKTAAAICAIDADVVGLIEIENNGSVALNDLLNGTSGINANCGPYAFVDTGVIGTDEIVVAFIYKAATAAPVGPYAVLTSSVDPRFIDTKNRPALAQTFEETATGSKVTVVVNHLKSKGSACDDVGDPNLNDGAANCNLTRANAAAAMVDWLATDPTGSGDPDFLIIGDLNAYRNEDPIENIELGPDDVAGTGDDYTDLLDSFGGAGAYSYLFDGQLGYLDHALANADLLSQVTGVTAWHINADEIPVFDYNDEILDAGEASFERESGTLPIYEPTAYRASDHDPVIIGLNLGGVVMNVVATCGGYDVILTETGDLIAPEFQGTLFVGTDKRDWINGTSGPDLILGLGGGDDLFGKNGDDVICGGDGKDIIKGMGGNDTLYGDDDADWLIGGPGNDTLSGGAGADDLLGNSGEDTMNGNAGYDVLIGGSSNDQLFGDDDPDALFGQSGDDALDGGNDDDYCNGGSGNDSFNACENTFRRNTGMTDANIDMVDEAEVMRLNDGEDGADAIEDRILDLFLPLINQ